ncbi:MAG TPA: MBL fold metallo-hydrolase [Acidimicrobiales bacterium]|nr:MBL fold metallo-hydrolase [Acidimicrobiales bacterium]
MYRDAQADELAARLGTADEPVVVDVREPDEFAAWSIPSAVNIPLSELERRASELPKDRELFTVCASGNRSASAAEMLAGAGRRVANLVGGMAGWAMTYDAVTLTFDHVDVVQIRRRGKGCLSYLVGAGGKCFVVDPSLDTDVYTRLADEHGWRIDRVFDTHLHADHLSGARVLAGAVDAHLHLNPADHFEFGYEALSEEDDFELPGGVSFHVAAIHTPGHTQGSSIYIVAGHFVLSGDTLFVDSVGRPDLAERAEEFAHNLYRSLHEKILTLPDDATVLPGHYGDHVVVRPDLSVGATLGELRQSVAPLSYDEDEFVAWATARAAPRPPHYVDIIKANMGRRVAPVATLRQLELGPNRCSVST